MARKPVPVFPFLPSPNTLVDKGSERAAGDRPDAAREAVTMTEKSRAPHKLSVVRAWRRAAARLHSRGDRPRTTEDYRRATAGRDRSVEALQRQELGNAAARGLGGGGYGGGM